MTKDALDMFDEARAMVATLKLCDITQEELARRLGTSQSYVANKLRLLKLSDEEIALIRENDLSERHARALLRLDSKDSRLVVLKKVIQMHLNVRECEAVVEMLHDADMPRRLSEVSPALRVEQFRQMLKESLDTLRSVGIDVKEYAERLGEKLYITLAIDMPV